MIGLQLLPVVISVVILGAHFLRAGNLVFVAVVLVALGLLGVRRPFAARLIQAVLLLGALEWLRTLASLVAWRAETGQPAVRLTVILGSMALFTGLSALVFHTSRLRSRYGLTRGRDASGA